MTPVDKDAKDAPIADHCRETPGEQEDESRQKGTDPDDVVETMRIINENSHRRPRPV